MTVARRLAALLVAVAVPAAFAGSVCDWSGVLALRKGDRVGVVSNSGKRVEGCFDRTTDSQITLRADQEITLEKADVARVYIPARHGRWFGAAAGGAIGLGVGLLADSTIGAHARNETGGTPKGVITVIVAASGAGIGAAVSGRYRTVYQRVK